MPYFVGVMFLSYYGGTKLESALIFIVMGFFSLFTAYIAHQNNIRPFKWWDGQFNKQDWKIIGIGYGLTLAIVLGITYVFGSGPVTIMVALIGGGIMLFVTLHEGETILVPIIIHGIYNTSALAFAGASIIPLTSFALYVPNFAFDDSAPVDFIAQIILQFGFVAFGEEFLKVSLALGGFVISGSRNFGIGMSIGMWAFLHSILAYRILLPF